MFAILVRSTLAFALAIACPAAGAQRINVALNGNPVTFVGTQPQEVKGRVMVPLRGVLEQMGSQVRWDAAKQTVTATRADTVIRLPVNQNTAEVNGRTVTLDIPAMLIRGRTMVPLRFVAESLGAAVSWDDSARLVRIATASPGDVTTPRDSRAFVRTRTVDTTDTPRRSVTAEPLITALAFIRENAIIPVTLDTALDSATTKPGDRVTATVEIGAYDGRLPRGTRFIGTVRQAVPARDGRSGLIALHFTELAFPDGTWRTINAHPYPMDSRAALVDESGHLVARPGGILRKLVFVGYKSGPRLIRADVLPNGRVRVFLEGSGGARDEPTEDASLPAGHRFGVNIDRQVVFDPVRAVAVDTR